MAMEWTSADVLRVMRENANAFGKVDLAAVRTSFNLSSPAKVEHFNAILRELNEKGQFVPSSTHIGYVNLR